MTPGKAQRADLIAELRETLPAAKDYTVQHTTAAIRAAIYPTVTVADEPVNLRTARIRIVDGHHELAALYDAYAQRIHTTIAELGEHR